MEPEPNIDLMNEVSHLKFQVGQLDNQVAALEAENAALSEIAITIVDKLDILTSAVPLLLMGLGVIFGGVVVLAFLRGLGRV